MSTSVISETRPKLAPLLCINCNAPGTRGWYDNASDRVNFVVPAFVTLMFVAIQIIVLRARG